MVSLVRGYPKARSQREGAQEPNRDPQQEDQLDTAEDKDIADYYPDVDYWVHNLQLSQSLKMKKKLILMQSIQTWKCPMMGPSTRG